MNADSIHISQPYLGMNSFDSICLHFSPPGVDSYILLTYAAKAAEWISCDYNLAVIL